MFDFIERKKSKREIPRDFDIFDGKEIFEDIDCLFCYDILLVDSLL